MDREHHFAVNVEWTGNRGTGTSDYVSYGREHRISAEGKSTITGSSAPPFRGDTQLWNPEELLIASLSQCHMLSYLHLAATNGIAVTNYTDAATGTMQSTKGGGHFTLVSLRPIVTIASGDPELARELHIAANENCFIASSVNFPVEHHVEILFASS